MVVVFWTILLHINKKPVFCLILNFVRTDLHFSKFLIKIFYVYITFKLVFRKFVSNRFLKTRSDSLFLRGHCFQVAGWALFEVTFGRYLCRNHSKIYIRKTDRNILLVYKVCRDFNS
jgi:hypothetical protein